jgi:hypothetical protein
MAGKTDDNAVRIVVGSVGLLFLSMRLRTRLMGTPMPRKAGISRGILWGSISGFTSFVSHAGAPAFQVYVLPQQLPKMMFAGTATILFAIINLMKVPPYLALGLIHWRDIGIFAILAPIALFGVWLGYRLTQIISERIFFMIVEIALFAISVLLIHAGLTA